MKTILIYPASVTCEIAPEYETTTQRDEIYNFKQSTGNVLADNEEDD